MTQMRCHGCLLLNLTLVGPFRAGKQEGPCQSFARDATSEIEAGLARLLRAFIDEAFAP